MRMRTKYCILQELVLFMRVSSAGYFYEASRAYLLQSIKIWDDFFMPWKIKNLWPGSPPTLHCSSERGSPQKAPPERKFHLWFFFIFWTAHNLLRLSSYSWSVTLSGQGSHQVLFTCSLVGFWDRRRCFCQLTDYKKNKYLRKRVQADMSQYKFTEKLNSQLSKCKETSPKNCSVQVLFGTYRWIFLQCKTSCNASKYLCPLCIRVWGIATSFIIKRGLFF